MVYSQFHKTGNGRANLRKVVKTRSDMMDEGEGAARPRNLWGFRREGHFRHLTPATSLAQVNLVLNSWIYVKLATKKKRNDLEYHKLR